MHYNVHCRLCVGVLWRFPHWMAVSSPCPSQKSSGRYLSLSLHSYLTSLHLSLSTSLSPSLSPFYPEFPPSFPSPLLSPTPCSPGFTKRVVGEGMPMSGESSRRGDLLVQYRVAFPSSLSPHQQTLITQALQ